MRKASWGSDTTAYSFFNVYYDANVLYFCCPGSCTASSRLLVGEETEKQQPGGKNHQHPLGGVGVQRWGGEEKRKSCHGLDRCFIRAVFSVHVSERSVVADSGVGAGIDSYYEYLLKAYVLLGDDQLLQRFNIVSVPRHTTRARTHTLSSCFQTRHVPFASLKTAHFVY